MKNNYDNLIGMKIYEIGLNLCKPVNERKIFDNEIMTIKAVNENEDGTITIIRKMEGWRGNFKWNFKSEAELNNFIQEMNAGRGSWVGSLKPISEDQGIIVFGRAFTVEAATKACKEKEAEVCAEQLEKAAAVWERAKALYAI